MIRSFPAHEHEIGSLSTVNIYNTINTKTSPYVTSYKNAYTHLRIYVIFPFISSFALLMLNLDNSLISIVCSKRSFYIMVFIQTLIQLFVHLLATTPHITIIYKFYKIEVEYHISCTSQR